MQKMIFIVEFVGSLDSILGSILFVLEFVEHVRSFEIAKAIVEIVVAAQAGIEV